MSYRKDPAARLDYAFDWASIAPDEDRGWLEVGEEITTFEITADPGLTVGSTSELNGIVTVWLSGGEDGKNYRVTCHIVTSQGRADERTIRIDVRHR